ncbi:MAG: hypothetical protein M5U19_12560 [Microthrixaceae bacterium]|nr:hypothetical protein [Microthrixaceae bacterium]
MSTPKSGLRDRHWHSRIDELTSGSFREVVPDTTVTDAPGVRRVVLASGKVSVEAELSVTGAAWTSR